MQLTFYIPFDFTSIVDLVLSFILTTGADGPNRNIDLESDYGKVGELYNQNSETDTTTVYDFTGLANRIVEIDISQVYSNLDGGHYCGLSVDPKPPLKGKMDILGIRLRYNCATPPTPAVPPPSRGSPPSPRRRRKGRRR